MKLSIGMIVRNEEKYLDKCLGALKSLMEEIDSELIIIDTGSTDKTIEIAKSYTDKVFMYEWNHDFAYMRNLTLKHAIGEWYLYIDADEILENPEDLINFLKSKSSKKYNTATINILNILDDSEIYEKVTVIRLARNRKNLRFSMPIHEQLNFEAPIAKIDIDFIHYGYISYDPVLMERKFKRNSEILISELKKDPENIYYLYHLGMTYGMNKKANEAKECFLKAYKIVKDQNLNINKYLYIYTVLASIYANLQLYKENNELCLEAINTRHMDIYYFLAQAQYKLEEYEESLINYENYLKEVNEYKQSGIQKDIAAPYRTLQFEDKAYYIISYLYYKKNNYILAFDYLEKVTTEDILSESIELYILTCLKLNRFDKLFIHFSRLLKMNNDLVNNFISKLENELTNLQYDIKEKIYCEFSNGEGIYSLLNKIRFKKVITNVQYDELTKLDFNQLQNFYGDILFILMENGKQITPIIEGITEERLDKLLEYIISQHNNYREIFIKYIDFIKDSIKSGNKTGNKTENLLCKEVSKYLLVFMQEEDNSFNQVLQSYLASGKIHIDSIYTKEQINYVDNIIYNSNEDEFLIIIFKAILEKDHNFESYVRLLNKAIKIYPQMHKVVKYIKDSDTKEQGDYDDMNNNAEFETYKKQIKEIISNNIDNNQTSEAAKLVTEYETIVPDDIELYSFKAIIAIKENRYKDAEEILREGLIKDNKNFDILYNYAYLYEVQGEQEEAINYYKKAFTNVKDDESKETLANILTELGAEKPFEITEHNTSIIILTYNNLEYNKLCIDSIRKYTTKDNYEIIVVDNNSTDGTVEWLKQQKDLKVIYNKENVGFPKGCNQGINIANKWNDILLLNNDVIVTPNWLDNLKTCLYSENNIGAVGAVTNNCSNNQVISANYNNLEELFVFSEKNNVSDYSKWVEKLRLVGFCLLIKREVVDKVGLLDEIFSPGNFEDDDYSYRIRQAGYKLYLCVDSYIHHFGSASFKKAPEVYNELLQINREKFKNKWGFDPTLINENNNSNKNDCNRNNSSNSDANDILDMEQTNVSFTGERLVINKEVKDKYNNVLEEHIERYKLASMLVKDKIVLDAACGAGYGTKMLGMAGAKSVVGIDISEESLNNAKGTYYGDNIKFDYGDVNQLNFPNESFDVVVSFETIEHIKDGARWINESSRILKEDGLFIVSTPNRDITNPGSYLEEHPLNQYHQYEYNTQEFIGELLKQYDIINLYGQTFFNNKDIPYINIMRQLRKLDLNYIPKESDRIEGHRLIPLENVKNSQPMYLVAVCKKKAKLFLNIKERQN